MSKFEDWTQEQAIALFEIAASNTQVRWILTDYDVAEFYNELISNYGLIDKNAEKVKEELNSIEDE